jgi:hypothetical protein
MTTTNVMLKPILKLLPLLPLACTLTSCCVVYPTTIVYLRPADSSSSDEDEGDSQIGMYAATLNAHPAKSHAITAWNSNAKNDRATNALPATLHIDVVPQQPKGNL